MALVALIALSLAGCREKHLWGRGPAGRVDAAETAEARPDDGGLGTYLEGLAEPPLGLAARHGATLEEVRALYEERELQPLWFAGPVLRGEARELVALLADADREGLPPERYRVATLRARVEEVDGPADAEEAYPLEVALTHAALLYASDLVAGAVRPDDLGGRWNVQEDEEPDLRGWLVETLATVDGEGLGATLAELSPGHEQYRRLIAARDRYRRIGAEGGWPAVPRGAVIGVGDAIDPARRAALVRRLAVEGFLDPADADPRSGVVTPAVAAAIERFQASRTLDVDGRLGPETQEELDVPAADRLRQLELNVERWRWIPGELGDPAVVVNLPAYRLDVLEDGRPAMRMGVIVGKPDWPTPVFSDRIEYLVLDPFWNVPESILEEEVVPKVHSDPAWFYEQGLEVVTGWGDTQRTLSMSALWNGRDGVRVRQRPGPENPLGRIKLMFPNAENVYLHDTPASVHFSDADRYLSHGCVRLERPFELAGYLMRGTEWTADRLRAATGGGVEREVSLPRKVPVHLVYFTAEVDEEGRIHFYEDIYGIDAAHAAAQSEILTPSTPPPPAAP